jgi:Domain of unknown function (DUF1929)/Glyoxal oxidase N-terminus
MKPCYLGVCAFILNVSFAIDAWSKDSQKVLVQEDAMGGKTTALISGKAAPMDFGSSGWQALAAKKIPSKPGAATKGVFGPAVNWPVIPIHLTLLPNGRVLSFGSDQAGLQGALVHAVWNPNLGTRASAHTVLPNAVSTDIFCAGQTVISSTGETLIVGGDETINGVRNYSVTDTTFYNYLTGKMYSGQPMAFKRWYSTLVALANGDILILGGRSEKDVPTYASTPEVYAHGAGFRTLLGAASDDAFGGNGDFPWYYPRGFLAPNGKVFIVANSGQTYWLDHTGNGSITGVANINALVGSWTLPSLMYAPGKILTLRESKKVVAFDLNGSEVKMKVIADRSHERIVSSSTVMADGKVFVNGGSEDYNKLQGVAYDAEIWDPKTEQWAIAASASKPRLYHSSTLLLPDGTLLTGGGGAPGPVTNLNAEIYYPPYLYKRGGSGKPATRPGITTAPKKIAWNKVFRVNVKSSSPISRVTFVRAGSSTHSLNVDQRFMELKFTKINNRTIRVVGPADVNIAPPGYYMMFVFDRNRVPSVAKLIHLQS